MLCKTTMESILFWKMNLVWLAERVFAFLYTLTISFIKKLWIIIKCWNRVNLSLFISYTRVKLTIWHWSCDMPHIIIAHTVWVIRYDSYHMSNFYDETNFGQNFVLLATEPQTVRMKTEPTTENGGQNVLNTIIVLSESVFVRMRLWISCGLPCSI